MFSTSKVQKALILGSILSTSSIFIANADEEPIIVSANLVETPYSAVASSVTKIGRAQIENSNLNSVADILRTVPGLTISQTGAAGGNTNVFTRGTESNHTLVLIDGIEVNDPSNPNRAFNFAHLSLSGIESIEVLKGPQSALYGTNAIGGVILINTLSGSENLKVNTGLNYGTYKSIDANVGLTNSFDKFKYSIHTDFSKSEGFSSARVENGDLDGREKFNVKTKLSNQSIKDVIIDLVLHYTFDKYDTDNYSSTSFVLIDDPNDKATSSEFYYKGSVQSFWLDGLLENKLSISGSSIYRKDERVSDSTDSKQSVNKDRGENQNISFLNSLIIDDYQSIVLGLEHKIERDKSRGESYEKKSAYTSSAFITHNLNYKNLFNASSIRLDKHELFGEEVTYRLAPGYRLDTTKTTFKGSLSTGFRAPSINQLYNTQSGNKDLKPEQSFNYEVGFEQPISNLVKINTTFFRNLIKDKFASQKVGSFTYLNVNKGKTEIQGVETSVEFNPTSSLNAKVSYTNLSTKVLDTNLQLMRRPNHKWHADLFYAISEKIQSNLQYEYIGRRDDGNPFDINFSRVGNDSYELVNFNLNYSHSKNLKLWFNARNLLDKTYEEVFGYNSEGRNLKVGCNYSF